MRILVFLLGSCLLYSCVKPSEEYLAKEKVRTDLVLKFNKICNIDNLDDKLDWLVAVFYFDNFVTSINNNDKNIIKNIAKLHSICPRNILILGHASNFEANTNTSDVMLLSSRRAVSVIKELLANDILLTYTTTLFCGNYSNLVKEDSHKYNNATTKYNQRVEVVFLNTPLATHTYDCLIEKQY